MIGTKMKIYIIAGEASGDIYGAKLIAALRKTNSDIEFFGIGGDKMTAEGLTSLFPMAEISIMGFLEVVKHIPHVLKRINQTVADIKTIQPDMVITIDSPGFCCRVADKLQNLRAAIKLVHYVAPTVWAYKPKRAQKFARLFDHLLVILPFEPPYFDAVNLPCTYIGHPITENSRVASTDEISAFRQKYNIAETDTVLCLMPGSRIGEVLRLLPIFLQSAQLMTATAKLKIVIPTIAAVSGLVQKIVDLSGAKAIILQNDAEKTTTFAAANIALVKSGTGTLEVSMSGCPMVIAYKISKISYWIIKSLIKIKYANLINIILNKELIPELLQNNCTAFLIAQHLDILLQKETIRTQQITESRSVLQLLGMGQEKCPSEKAAEAVLAIIAH
jgi:lipid-A-disaccharide synthase